MTASDAETFFVSPLYWSKMVLVALLLLNGLGLLAAERASAASGRKGWLWLARSTSAASLVLWLVILFFGVWLTVAA